MTLATIAVVVLGSALRAGLGTWERQEKRGAHGDVFYGLARSFERDLDFLAQVTRLPGQVEQPLPLCGGPRSVAFWSLYAPEGSPHQGLHLTAYVYREESAQLEVYRIKAAGDVNALEITRRLGNGNTHTWTPMGVYEGVQAFELAYGAKKPGAYEDEVVWSDAWPCEDHDMVPSTLRLTLALTATGGAETKSFYFLTKPGNL